MTEDIWTLLPMRGIDRGKSRLLPALGADGRAALNRRLLARTLSAVGSWAGALSRCIVISPCTSALAAATRVGAVALQETGTGGLNPALRAGLAAAVARGARRVLVLPCDLPQLSARALTALTAEVCGPMHMVLAPDESGSGTNALLAEAHAGLEFQFGPHSLARHRQWATGRGWTVSLLPHPDLAFDLDTPADLARCATLAPSGTSGTYSG